MSLLDFAARRARFGLVALLAALVACPTTAPEPMDQAATTTTSGGGEGGANACLRFATENHDCQLCLESGCPQQALACAESSECREEGDTVVPEGGCFAQLECIHASCASAELGCLEQCSADDAATLLATCIGRYCTKPCWDPGQAGGPEG